MKVPSRWLPFVEACAAGIPPSGVLQARAEQLLEAHQASQARRLARSLPSRRAKAQQKTERTGARQAVRAAVVTRAGGRCEACGVEVTSRAGHMDHFFGRARSEAVETCWLLCPQHDLDKTTNRPTRRFWLERFRRHAVLHGYGRAIQMVDQLLALEPGEAR